MSDTKSPPLTAAVNAPVTPEPVVSPSGTVAAAPASVDRVVSPGEQGPTSGGNVISPSASQSRLLSMLLGLEAKKSGKSAQTPPRQDSTHLSLNPVSDRSMDINDTLMTPPGFGAVAPPQVESFADKSPARQSSALPILEVKSHSSTAGPQAGLGFDLSSMISPSRVPVSQLGAQDSGLLRDPRGLGIDESRMFQAPPVHHQQAPVMPQYYSNVPPSFILQHNPYAASSGYYMPHHNVPQHMMPPQMYPQQGTGAPPYMDMHAPLGMFPPARDNWNAPLPSQQLYPPRNVQQVPQAHSLNSFAAFEQQQQIRGNEPYGRPFPVMPTGNMDPTRRDNASFPRGGYPGGYGPPPEVSRFDMHQGLDNSQYGSHQQPVAKLDSNSLLRAALGMNSSPAGVTSSTAMFDGAAAGSRNRLQSVDSEMSFNHDSIVDGAISRSTDNTPSNEVSGTKAVATTPVSETAAGAGAGTATTPHRIVRTTRNQPGVLTVLLARGKGQPNIKCESDNFSVRPATHLTVHWQLPAHIFENKSNDSLVIGILRYGSLANQPAIVTKQVGPISSAAARSKDMFGNAIVSGSMPFHAPKGSGRFVFRMFNNSTNKSATAVTLATSLSFSVDLVDMDVTSNLRFSLDAFAEGQSGKAVQQLTCTVVAMRNPGKFMRGDDPRVLMNENMGYALRLVDEMSAVVDTARDRANAEKAKKAAASAAEGEIGDEDALDEVKKAEDEKYWIAARNAQRLQVDLLEYFTECTQNRIVWNMLSEAFKEALHTKLNLYCPVLNRFFKDIQSLNSARLSELGFLPVHANARPADSTGAKIQLLDRQLAQRAPALYPPHGFEEGREAIRSRLEKMLNDSSALPERAKLHLYGSSCNLFGVQTADVDMCLSLQSMNISADTRPAFLENLGKILAALGMSEVAVRSTARIPIVNFKDPETGLDCDISYYNPLAVCNTKLLRSYCLCDYRVRPLAYIIKQWAKNRKINSPGDGTLSSYGYILCLIHFLQTRRMPVVPYLQRLPRNWRGEAEGMPMVDPALAEHEIELHPVDNSPCRTYFYQVTEDNLRYCKVILAVQLWHHKMANGLCCIRALEVGILPLLPNF
jgi:hypothetical protein